ncbi:hypothetical protein DL96DRAFT_1716011 [Flagelloscypha sp. PMI_526]|nr:hypothetical protein DL96DRAFT_1716011 [Flagelloscypha sp. PMI_526]
MPTPSAGTSKQPDIETPYRPYKRPYRGWVHEYLVPILWVSFYTTVSSGYNVGACALGRFMLDHLHLWEWSIPLDTPSINKHAELIAACVAGCLASLATIGVVLILFWLDRHLKKRGVKFQFGDSVYTMIWAHVIINWVLVVLAGLMFHPRFQDVNALSMLAIYGFGNLLLLPTLYLLRYMIIKICWVYFPPKLTR